MTLSFFWSSYGEPEEWGIQVYNQEFTHHLDSHRLNWDQYLMRSRETNNELCTTFVGPGEVEYVYIRLIGSQELKDPMIPVLP